nr:uncharacterized protein LOC109762022 isoform X1 [Aegilops tauschii subsp. strangulata]
MERRAVARWQSCAEGGGATMASYARSACGVGDLGELRRHLPPPPSPPTRTAGSRSPLLFRVCRQGGAAPAAGRSSSRGRGGAALAAGRSSSRGCGGAAQSAGRSRPEAMAAGACVLFLPLVRVCCSCRFLPLVNAGCSCYGKRPVGAMERGRSRCWERCLVFGLGLLSSRTNSFDRCPDSFRTNRSVWGGPRPNVRPLSASLIRIKQEANRHPPASRIGRV